VKIILDTNVLISSLVFKGAAFRVHDFCLQYEEIYISDFILDELSEKLSEKFQIKGKELAAIRRHIDSTTKLVFPSGKIPEICRDKDDNNILHLAKAINADFIITGDKDLLEIKVFKQTRIVSPKEFIEQFIK